jgi:hypothetical protein
MEQINRVSHELARNPEDLFDWWKNRESKRERRKQEQESQLDHLANHTKLSRGTRRLITASDRSRPPPPPTFPSPRSVYKDEKVLEKSTRGWDKRQQDSGRPATERKGAGFGGGNQRRIACSDAFSDEGQRHE